MNNIGISSRGFWEVTDQDILKPGEHKYKNTLLIEKIKRKTFRDKMSDFEFLLNFPIALGIAQTPITMDLVPVVPMESPNMSMLFYDYSYHQDIEHNEHKKLLTEKIKISK